MRKTRFSDEQIVAILREADRDPVAAVAKRHGVQRPRERRGGALRCVGPPRPAPSLHRPIRGSQRQQQGWSSQAERGPKKTGRSLSRNDSGTLMEARQAPVAI